MGSIDLALIGYELTIGAKNREKNRNSLPPSEKNPEDAVKENLEYYRRNRTGDTMST